MILLNVNFSEEDRARVDKLTAALSDLADALNILGYAAALKAEQDHFAAPLQPTEPEKAPEPPAPAVEPPAPAAPAPVISLPEFQKALAIRCSESLETKARVRAILNEYAPAASAVPEDKRAEILARLAAL
jgi:hypothetical protein